VAGARAHRRLRWRGDRRSCGSRRWRSLAALALVAALVAALATVAAPAAAQRPAGVQWEGRVDAIGARTPALQLGVGANVAAGLYVRVGGGLAAGLAYRDREARGAARADVTARFHLDPFRESRIGLYGLGGVSAMYDGFEHWRPRVVAGLGVESRARKRTLLAAELSLGGGVRAAFVLRRARGFGR